MSGESTLDIDRVREFVTQKREKRKRLLDERFSQATVDFASIVSRIISEINPLRIYQWGSLLDRSRFSEISDIDIALEGIKNVEQYFRALGIADECTALPVDVVELERLPINIANRIRATGRKVYERSDQ